MASKEMKSSNKCKECSRDIGKRNCYGGLCQACYNYFKSGRAVYKLPPAGKIERTEDGYVICHICGRAYKRLGSHAREFHDMTIREYKERFGLCKRSKTTEKSYSDYMSKSALKNKMDEQLLRVGEKTRCSKTNKPRLGKPGALQWRLEMREKISKTV